MNKRTFLLALVLTALVFVGSAVAAGVFIALFG